MNQTLERHIPKGYPRCLADLADWEIYALEKLAEVFQPSEKREPIEVGADYWTAAQTVSQMEHIVRREIEKTSRGAFLPTYARHWKVDGRDYSKERPLLTGYVFFLTRSDDWAGIPDIHGVYRVLTSCVQPNEIKRLMVDHASGQHNETGTPRYTRYYRPPTKKSVRYNSRRPRPGKRIRNIHAQ